MSKSISTFLMAGAMVMAIAGVTAAIAVQGPVDRPRGEQPRAKPALAVTTTFPRASTIPVRIRANGNIAAWQEATIGTESAGLRLTDVKVNVGDVVKRGQVVATFEAGTVGAELSHSRAALLESEAALAEAAANAQRARYLQASGALSAQQINQFLTAERTAHARMEAAKATARMQELRLAQTSVLAPDDGVISARNAAVGAVLGTGQELFRIIRKGRLEWRAEVAAPELARLKPGQTVLVTPSGGEPIKSTLRIVAPSVDTQTRNGLVYVDLPSGTTARAGMFARGEIDIGADSRAMTLPQAAVLQRDGFDYVFLVGADSRVVKTKVTLGRRVNDRVEILAGLDATSTVVAAGGGFLSDGDLVHLVEAQAVPRKLASGSATALK